jgi:hypothetical protein
MTIFRLVGGTDVQPSRAAELPKHKRGRPPTSSTCSTVKPVEEACIDPPSTEAMTATAKNGRLREQREESWRRAEAATRYWRVRMTFHDAISQAQRMEISEGRNHPIVDSDDRTPIVRQWREALARQVLTPAPDANSVKWKHVVLDSGDLAYTGVKPERVERAIADDLAFLAAHPVRQSNRKAKDDGGAA